MSKLKEFYLDSIEEFKKPRTLALCGMLGALAVVLSMTASIQIGNYIKIGFTSIPNRMVDYLFGPVVGALFGGAMDIVKFVVKPTGAYFFGYTFNAMLAGVIFGSITYRRPLTIKRLLIADFLNKLIVNCVFNTLWICVVGGSALSAILVPRLIKNLIMWPIDTAILMAILTAISPIVKRFGFLDRTAASGGDSLKQIKD